MVSKSHFVSFQSSLSVGSDLDLSETPTPAYPLRRSWDAGQETAGLEVKGFECKNVDGFRHKKKKKSTSFNSVPTRPTCTGVDVQLLPVPQL